MEDKLKKEETRKMMTLTKEDTQFIPRSLSHLFPTTINYQSQKLALDSVPAEHVACRPI